MEHPGGPHSGPGRPPGQRGREGGGAAPLLSPSPGAPRRRRRGRGSSQPVNAGERNICFPRAPSEQRGGHKAGIQASEAELGARPDHGPLCLASGETEARGDRASQLPLPELRYRPLPSCCLPGASLSLRVVFGSPRAVPAPGTGYSSSRGRRRGSNTTSEVERDDPYPEFPVGQGTSSPPPTHP